MTISHATAADPVTKLEREFLQQLTIRPYVPVLDMIDRLLKGIQDAYPGARCSILKLSPENTLLHYSAPDLPKRYTDLINGLRPGPRVGSCGTAVYYDRIIIVADTFSDPLWEDYAEIARTFGLGSCWSVPLHYSSGAILGTFAIYHLQHMIPSGAMIAGIERLANLIGLVIENREMIEDLRLERQLLQQSEARYRNLFQSSPLPTWIVDLETGAFIEVNEAALLHYGYSLREFSEMSVFDLRLPAEDDRLKKIFRLEKIGDRSCLEGRFKHRKKNGELIYVDTVTHKLLYNGRRSVLVLVHDVTEKLLLQEKLNEEKGIRQKEIVKATIMGQEKEREEIGYQLHEKVNQTLSAAKLCFECAGRTEDQKEQYQQAGIELIVLAIDEIRQICRTVSPPRLHDFGLVNVMNELLNHLQLTKNIEVDFSHDHFSEQSLDDSLKLTIYRITQQQISNVIKHAGAGKFSLVFHKAAEYLQVNMHDNGKGFDSECLEKGIGFTNIMSRASIHDGEIHIESAPGSGCSLGLCFPL